MNTYEIPRNYKGESRILVIFSVKALAYTVVGLLLGLVFYLFFSTIGFKVIGITLDALCGLTGFLIGTIKIPENKKFAFTRQTGGEYLDDIIKRWVKFKKNKTKIYVTKEQK